LTGLAITDSFPAGVEVAATPAATNTCGGTFNPLAAATAISLSGGSLTSSGACSISVAVRGTTAGVKNNVTGNVSSTESGNGLTASATLNVFAPPTITKAFSPTTVALNGTSVLTLTITNPAANPAGVNGVAVSDTFPAGLVVHTTPGATNTCGGAFAPSAGATNIALTGGAIATAGGSCSVSVTVRGTTSGAKLNTTGAVSSTEGGAGLTASATLNVFAPPTVTKAFSPNSIQLNNISTLTITITNPATNSGGVTGVAINDPFPAGLEVDAVPMATNTCGGVFTANAAATSINLTGGAIASAGGSCSISVKVKGTTQGLKTNTTGAVSSTEGGAGLTATATLDVITCNSITCPANVFTATTGNSSVVNYPAPTADGICGTITCTPASGSTFNVGTTTVTCNSSIGNQSCSFNVTVNRVGGTATDPLACTGPGNTVQATLVITNNGNVNQTVSDTTTFTNLVGVPNSCTANPNVGACVVTNGNLTYNGTLTPGQTVTLTYLTQVSDLAPAGAQVCTNNSVAFNGGNPFAFSVCGVVNCPVTGPGLPFPARSEASDQGAGSVLIYNIYTSSASAPNSQNTKVALTNTHPSLSSTVHLFFVDGTSCSVADSYVCLTANQTSSFLMSDIDPGTTGYLVAVATDTRGCPINFNYLIGDEYVKFQSGHAANLGAQAYSAIPGGLVACDQNSVTATLNFDGVSYDRTGRTLALDSIGAKADGNDTMLVVNRIGGNLGIGASTLGTIFGIFYDDSENSLSFNIAGACQLRNSISNNFPRTTPRFETFIPAGRTGWMKFFSQSDIGMTGAAINLNPNATASAGAFNQGHNLHVLTLSSAASYVIPVFPPSC
ncbi:MAG: beta strand repeat-containing protein, partial [Blastocatellia bacterium]